MPIKFLARFLTIAIKDTKADPCFCIERRFIFGFHTRDCKVFLGAQRQAAELLSPSLSVLRVQCIHVTSPETFLLTWARDLKCWLLLCAY